MAVHGDFVIGQEIFFKVHVVIIIDGEDHGADIGLGLGVHFDPALPGDKETKAGDLDIVLAVDMEIGGPVPVGAHEDSKLGQLADAGSGIHKEIFAVDIGSAVDHGGT